jgi:ABC-type amino acid transport substrate-binding protein
MAIGAISVTAEREARFDFSYPYFLTGLAIAVEPQDKPWLQVARGFLSLSFWKIAGAIITILLLVGILIWRAERHANPRDFGGRAHHGIGSGFWWAAVTMTTVGYGDKSPRTIAGRVVALLWMFTAVLLISVITAAITSTLTVSRLGSSIEGPADLPSARIACVPGTTGEVYLETHGLSFQPADSLAEALDMLAHREVNCVVHDAPLLKYLVRKRFPGRAETLPGIFDRQEYAILLPQASSWREQINYQLLLSIQSDWWDDTLERYLGE